MQVQRTNSMQRQALGQAHLRRSRYRLGTFLVKFLWFCLYVSVTIAALLSTYAFPELISVFRHQSRPKYTHYHISSQGADMGLQSRRTELSVKQELLPLHVSRGNPMNFTDLHHDDFSKRWKPPPNRDYVACVEPSPSYKAPVLPSRGYLLVSTNGGLNQMRAGICDMVAVARIINATLVIPELDKRSFWADSSNFSDIFNDDYFIEALQGDVPVVKRLPPELVDAPRASRQFRSWSYTKYYEEEVAALWEEYQVIKALKSDARLSNNDLPPDIQKLRCRVHYDALRFAQSIEACGKMLVERLRANGPFIALHLRYEKDMLAFTGCTYGLTEEDADALTLIRYHTPHWKVKDIDAAEQRAEGFCPLTPKEVGIFLRALGYPQNTQIYIAAGEIFGGDERMADLRSYFPNLLRKETVATAEELAPFKNHASQMAALDYIVSVESDVFVPSYSGNMARAVEGHRRFLGHRKTISPDRKELVALFDKLESGELEEGPELSRSIIALHRTRQGAPRKRKGPLKGTKGRDRFRTEEAFYTNPLPDCLCQKPGLKGKSSSKKSH
ncbi:hypothetical protein R1sor_018565 [Riccia sorocarpa]|uniref:O-fucosyltransferase family protein n=1 Tax=Riccia sorocarpa TaxID=122646 RepID=A0ABD3IA24_9MARC